MSDGVTYVDYGVSGSATATTGLAVVDGFVTNGTTKVDFDLKNSYSDVANGTIAFDYSLNASTLDVALKYVIGITQVSTSAALADIDVKLTGPHGNVGIDGVLTEGVGELTATVNGDDFAVVTLDENSDVATITKPDGSALHCAGVRSARSDLGCRAQGTGCVRGPARPAGQPALSSPAALKTERPGSCPGVFSCGDERT